MKKMLLLILVFVVFTGFNGLDVKNAGSENMELDLIAKQPLPPRVVNVYPSHEISVDEGQMLMFGVDYESTSSPDILVRRGTEILRVSDSCSMTMSGSEVRILLKRLSVEDSGEYSITLDNGIGATMTRFRIRVIEREK